jgi:hypothetical protein
VARGVAKTITTRMTTGKISARTTSAFQHSSSGLIYGSFKMAISELPEKSHFDQVRVGRVSGPGELGEIPVFKEVGELVNISQEGV